MIDFSDADDHFLMFSQMYYSQPPPQQAGELKPPRRRRKKNKTGDNSSSSGGAKKRKLNQEQIDLLEMNFGNEHKLESQRKDRLAAELGLDPRQVAVWFQNRRARWKNKKLEEEYNKLKNANESVVVEKCRLESEVLKLKEQLFDAEREIQRLAAERVDVVPSNSPASSVTVENRDPPFLGEFGVEGYEDVFYMPESSYIPGMEWVNMYM